MWKTVKDQTGQNNHKVPQIIREGKFFFTKPKDKANSLNRQYIQVIRETIKNIPPSNTNPLIHYKKHLGPVDSKLDLQTSHYVPIQADHNKNVTNHQCSKGLHINENNKRSR